MTITAIRLPLLFAVVLTLLLILLDMLVNLPGPSEDGSRSANELPPELSLTKNQQQVDAKIDKVRSLLGKYQQPEDNEQQDPQAQQKGLSEQAQQQQQGLLRQLYIGDKLYRLGGLVWRDEQWVALLVEQNLADDSQRLVTLSEQAQLGPYTITTIEATRMALAEDLRKIEMRLFLPQGSIASDN